jgi:O-antigen/teichoic acid export membrane protein
MLISSILNSFANHFLIAYRSIDKFNIEAKYVFFNNIMLFMLVSIVAVTTGDLNYIIYSFIVVKFIYLCFTGHLFKKDFGFIYKKIDFLNEYKNGFAFAVHLAVGAFYLNVDTLILKQYISLEEIGIYQAGLKFLGATTILMGVLNSVLLPKFTQILNTDKKIFIKTVVKFNLITISLGLAISLIINIFNEELINIIFGKNFSGLIQYIFLFSIIVFLRYSGIIYGTLLTISDKQKVRTYGVVFTLFFIVICDIFVIPIYEVYGALVVLIIAHILLNLVYIFFTYKEYGSFFIKNGVTI